MCRRFKVTLCHDERTEWFSAIAKKNSKAWAECGWSESSRSNKEGTPTYMQSLICDFVIGIICALPICRIRAHAQTCAINDSKACKYVSNVQVMCMCLHYVRMRTCRALRI